MSSYWKQTKHPVTGKWMQALWADDYFGPHCYGVLFPNDPQGYDPDVHDMPTREGEMVDLAKLIEEYES